MSFLREIGWRHQERLEAASLGYRFADYGLGLDYDMLPDEVVHMAKRCLLDTIGCAIGAWDSPGRPICERAFAALGGRPEATAIGSGARTSALNATLFNSFLVRFLDFNDLGGGGHNSDSIPSLIAVAEREGANGEELLRSIVVSYELGTRVSEGILDWRGWNGDTRASLIVPPAIARMLKLDTEQVANAIGIAASGNFCLGVLDTPNEERVMRKNLRFGWGASAAITSCLLARRGFTGPVRVFEGERGMNEVMFANKADFVPMCDFRGWRILLTRFKYLCANVSLQGLLQATLEIVRENDIKPEDVASVNIKMTPGASAIRPTVTIKYPRTAEAADHSAFYLTAVAIKDREMTADSIQPEKFTDPVILDLIEKITVEGDPSIAPAPKVKYRSSVGFEGKSEIVTRDGRRFARSVVVPHGFWDGSDLTDRELEEKFARMASRYMSTEKIDRLFQAIWAVDKLENVSELMKLTVFEKH